MNPEADCTPDCLYDHLCTGIGCKLGGEVGEPQPHDCSKEGSPRKLTVADEVLYPLPKQRSLF